MRVRCTNSRSALGVKIWNKILLSGNIGDCVRPECDQSVRRMWVTLYVGAGWLVTGNVGRQYHTYEECLAELERMGEYHIAT
jgi:hypothetical protein